MKKNVTEKRPVGRPPWAITKENYNDVQGYLGRKIKREYVNAEKYLKQLNVCRSPEDIDVWARNFLSASDWRSMVRAMQKQAERNPKRKATTPSRVIVELSLDVYKSLRNFSKAYRCGTLSESVRSLLEAHEVLYKD